MTAVEDEDLVVTHVVVEPPIPTRRRIISGLVILLAGVICIVGWGVGAKAGDAAVRAVGGR